MSTRAPDAPGASLPLARRTIVVTRPREQAAGLAALVEQAGGGVLLFPTIEIRDLGAGEMPLATIDRFAGFDLAVFVSPLAVRKGLRLLRARLPDAALPGRVRIAALGAGTRRELEHEGFARVIAPQGRADSEALLALPELAAVAGWSVLVLRGDAGRELLGDTLRARGARVEYAQCYQRVQPECDCAPLLAAWERGSLDAVTVSSGEGLANLCAMLDEPGRRLLARTPLVVPHPRIAEQARRLGLPCVQAAGPGDAEMLDALVAYFRDAK